jgi:hypothetical protein
LAFDGVSFDQKSGMSGIIAANNWQESGNDDAEAWPHYEMFAEFLKEFALRGVILFCSLFK